MISKKITMILIFVFAATALFYAQTNPVQKGLAAITQEAVQSQLEFLASDWMEGRETTTKGEFMAGDYIASMFKLYGLKPAGDDEPRQMGRRPSGPPAGGPGQMPGTPAKKTYFQGIPFLETEAGSGEQTMALVIKEGAVEKKLYFSGSDFSLSGSGVGIEFTAPVVFVGYGFKNDEFGYDDFKGVDVKGKIIIRISGVPGQNDPNSEIYKKLELGDFRKSMSLSRDKNAIAEKLGAVGVIEIASANNPMIRMGGPGGRRGGAQYANYPFRYASAFYEGDKPLTAGLHRLSLPEDSLKTGIVTLNLSAKVTAELMKGTDLKIAEYEKNPKMKIAKELKGKSVYVKSISANKTVLGRNVVAMIEGENPDEVVVVGAHYDHMGIKDGYIWNGADDNASGTVGVMTVAKAMIATGVKPKRTIIFAAWTGEEKGLFGSQYFVSKYKNVENIKLNLNYDMISRDEPTDSAGVKVGIQYSQNWPVLKEVVEKANQNYNLGLKLSFQPSVRPTGGSDFQNFSAKDIPVYGFMAAMHSDYHNPTDTADKVDIKKMTNIIKAGYLAIWELANMDKIEPAK